MATNLWKEDEEEKLISAAAESAAIKANNTTNTTNTTNTAGSEEPDTRNEWEKYRDNYIDKYNNMYERYGRRAMQDTLGEISARTGGLASSYAGAVAQDTYDNYMAELADRYPELVQAAYSMYQLDRSMAVPAATSAATASQGSGGSSSRSSSYRGSSYSPSANSDTSYTGEVGTPTLNNTSAETALTEAQEKKKQQETFEGYTAALNTGMYSPTTAWAMAEAAANGNAEQANLIANVYAGNGLRSTASKSSNKTNTTSSYSSGNLSPTMITAIQQAEAIGNYEQANLLRQMYGG